jgi:hypothetical protein
MLERALMPRKFPQTRLRAPATGPSRLELAELIIEEMAHRQGQRHGPYFEWSYATELFERRFEQAWKRWCCTDPALEILGPFIAAFVDAWPEGAPALRVVPDSRDSIANPPYSKNGLWPAFLQRHK